MGKTHLLVYLIYGSVEVNRENARISQSGNAPGGTNEEGIWDRE